MFGALEMVVNIPLKFAEVSKGVLKFRRYTRPRGLPVTASAFTLRFGIDDHEPSCMGTP